MRIPCYDDWRLDINYYWFLFEDGDEKTEQVLNLLGKQVGVLLLDKVGDIRYYFVKPAILLHFICWFDENHLLIFYFAAQHVLVDSISERGRFLVISYRVFHVLINILALPILLGHPIVAIKTIGLSIAHLEHLRHF